MEERSVKINNVHNLASGDLLYNRVCSCARHEGISGSGRVAPRILNFDCR